MAADDEQKPLTDDERATLAQRIARRELPRTEPVEQPTAVVTGGQPGSGKSTIVNALVANFDTMGGVFVIDPDMIRPQLGYMRPIIQQGSLEVPAAANVDAGTIAYQLVQIAKKEQRNILIDGTLQNTERAVDLAGELKAAGYSVEMHGMAVYPDLSHARTYNRREAEIATSATGFGRGVSDEFHDQAVDGYTATLASYYQGKHVDGISLYGYHGELELQLRLVNGQWIPETSPTEVLAQAHQAPSEAIKVEAAVTWSEAAEAMVQRGAPPAEQAKVRRFRDAAMDAIKTVPADPGATYVGEILRADAGEPIVQNVDGAAIAHDRAQLYGKTDLLKVGAEVQIKYAGTIGQVSDPNQQTRGRGR